MDLPLKIVIIVAVAAVWIALVVCIAVPVLLYQALFGKRQNRNPLLTYYSPERFGLDVEPFPVPYQGENLYGAIYRARGLEECDKLVIFAHGMGPGHCAYMTEIAAFCRFGYAVLAYDNYGCDRSPGEKIGGLYAGVKAVVAAYSAANSDERLKDKKIVLVGHSWGAYSVLCALESVKPSGVVAISAMNCANKLSGDDFLCALTQPMLSILGLALDGKKSRIKSVGVLEQSGVPALLVWGEKDRSVTRKNSAAVLAHGDHIQKLVLSDKRHNPYNTVAAEDKLAELSCALSKDKKFASEEAKREYFTSFDYAAATEEDQDVMDKIAAFIGRL